MNPCDFRDAFDLLADTPNGVEHLRKLILDLAVRGKLVPAQAEDTPAIDCLKQIDAEKERLSGANEGKRPRQVAEVAIGQQPFALPQGWAWTRLDRVCLVVTDGDHLPPPQASDGVPFLVIGNVRGGSLDFSTTRFVRKDYFEQLDSIRKPKQGDVLYTVTGSYGIPVHVDSNREFCVQRHIAILKPATCVDGRFLERVLASSLVFSQATACATGIAQKTVSLQNLRSIIIPLAPGGEQKRVVGKVDQLMALCDEFESRQQRRRQVRVHLNDAALGRIVAASDPAELAAAWQRVRDNFDLLYAVPENVAKLRQAILQLAVQGKLVPQDPNDEHAERLVDRIRAFQKGQQSKGRTRPPKVRANAESGPWPLPNGWCWARFADVTVNRDGERVPLSRAVREGRKGAYDYYGASGVIDHIDDYLFEKPLLLIGEDGANLVLRSTPIAFIATGKYWVNNHAHVIDSISLDCLRYLEVFINAIDLKPYVTGTAQPKMNQAKMNSIPVALPPANEQKRIVARVNQLISLCDDLEAKLKQQRDHADRLAQAIVNAVINGKAPSGIAAR